MALKRLIGNELFNPITNDLKSLNDIILDDDNNLIIGIFLVSAQCPQCVDFTKKLKSFYELRKEISPRFEIITFSLEEDENLYQESLQNIPWPALPRTAARHKKTRLLRRLRLGAVAPALALIEAPSGRLVTSAARDRLLEDPESFPWRPPTLREVLTDVELQGSGETKKYEDIKGVKAFYFSANWCPPCKAFTPQLMETYSQVKERGQNFEVIFVSSDRSETSYEQYMRGMPWLSVPFSREDVRRDLASTLGVQGIPCLVLVDAEDQLITDEGRAEVCEDPCGKYFPWPARRVSPLNERTVVKLQDRPAIILLVETEEELEFAENAVKPAATEYWDTRRHMEEDDEEELLFFVGCDSETADALREFAGLEDCVPLLTLIDVMSQRVSTLEDGAEVTSESVRRFLNNYLSNQLTWTEMTPPIAPDTSCNTTVMSQHQPPTSAPC